MLLDRRTPQRDSLIAGMAALRNGASGAAPAQPAPPVQPAAEPAAPPAEAPAEAPAESQPPQPATTEPATQPESPADPQADPPGMAQLRKQEQHLRRQIAHERAQMLAEFDQQKAAWQAKLDEAGKLEQKLAAARQDPIAAFNALGFTDADYEAVGRALYAHSPEGRKDPRHAEAAARALEKRSQETREEKREREWNEFKEKQAQAEQAAYVQAKIDEYYESLTGALADDSPHARYLVGKNPRGAQAQLLQIADRLYTESGPSHDLREMPAPAQVLKAYEAERLAQIKSDLSELAALGIDPMSLIKPAAKPAPAQAVPAATPAAPPQPAQAAAPAIAAPEAPPATPSIPKQPPSRDEVLAQLAKFRNASMAG